MVWLNVKAYERQVRKKLPFSFLLLAAGSRQRIAWKTGEESGPYQDVQALK